MLNLSNVLTIAQYFRHHPTLQVLDMTNNISFPSACEFIADVILSVNKALIYLDVCGRNIRPRYVEDYLSPFTYENDSTKHGLQTLYSFNIAIVIKLLFIYYYNQVQSLRINYLAS